MRTDPPRASTSSGDHSNSSTFARRPAVKTGGCSRRMTVSGIWSARRRSASRCIAAFATSYGTVPGRISQAGTGMTWRLSDAEILGEVPALEVLLHPCEEPGGELAIDHPVVPRHREVDHAPDRDRIIDHDRAFHDRVEGQDPDVGLIDDRDARDGPVRTGVSDRERRPLHLVRLELMGTGACGQVRDRPCDADR